MRHTVNLRVLFQDDHLVAISKPSGTLVHRSDRSTDREVVLQTLATQLGAYLYPVQRLDRGTSGVLVFALSSQDARELNLALAAPSTAKEYLTLARWPQHRFPLPDAWESTRPLRNDAGEPRPAHTGFRVVEHFGRFALLRARLHTGRYRQIRRHLNHCARHVVGDTSHGKGRINQLFRDQYGLDRMFLHAERLAFEHPVLKEPVVVEDPLPEQLEGVLAALRADVEG